MDYFYDYLEQLAENGTEAVESGFVDSFEEKIKD